MFGIDIGYEMLLAIQGLVFPEVALAAIPTSILRKKFVKIV